MTLQRRCLTARGRVQGVGFRPHVWRVASALGLAGQVANHASGVVIEIEGKPAQLDAFAVQLLASLPPQAQVDSLTSHALPPQGEQGFVIAASEGNVAQVRLPADSAPCDACLAELCQPGGRHWRHAFINCTQCGPRYSVTRALPYDRSATTLAGFALCAACHADYHHPASRRFHAEPTCCPACGPQLQYRGADGAPLAGDPLALALATLQGGGIVAIKSSGGFHLACDARNAAAIARLRQRKHRPAKPLALMAANLASLHGVVQLDATAAALLASPARPIVLLPRSELALPDALAPGLAELGVLLPPTPLHLLLWHEAAGRPAGTGWLDEAQPMLLVMTSGNTSGAPVAIDNHEALTALAGIADGFLLHDRAIHARSDDSVLRVDALGTATLRRSRGYVPDVLPLAGDGATVLATGSYLKNAPALLYGNAALPGAHVGDLAHPAACVALEHAVAALQLHAGHPPQAMACDNGEHFASQLAAQLAAAAKVPLVPVGHHHAHIGAVCAEHQLHGPVLGLALDGHGVGDDGGAWGGELLLVDGAHSQRIGHLTPLALPGGDAAARAPWRVAAAWLLQHGHADEAERRFGAQPAWPLLGQQLARGINTPYSSSMGRYFDLVAALAGVCLQQGYEGEAPQRLQALARPATPLAGGWHIDAANVLQLTPLLQPLLAQPDAAAIASLWHATLAAALASWLLAAAQHHNINTVALGGGCFANRTLLAALLPPLQQAGLAVYHPQALPAGDGGLAVGQAWVARQVLANKETDPCAWPCR